MAKCSNCNGIGLVPSLVLGKFSGKPIPNCFTRCECNPEETEHYHRITPADFDYSMDWSQWRWVCQTYGKGDPGPDESVKEPVAEFRFEPDWLATPPVYQQDIDQLKGNLVSLRDVLKQHVNETRPKKKVDKKWQ